MEVREVSMNGEKLHPFKNFFKRTIPIILYTPLFFLLINLYKLFNHKKKRFKHKVSLCLIFKDEGPYLKEWIEYHLLIGIDHFYLYNNFSSDNYQEILKPYIDRGIVTLIEFPYEFAQVKAYTDCYQQFKNESEWIGYIDADEFINLRKHNDIKEFLSIYRNYPSLYLNWLMFGTSGLEKEDKKRLVIEQFTQSWEYLCATGKTFINNNFENHIPHIHTHHCTLWGIPLFSITPIKSVSIKMHTAFTHGIDRIAFINHYWSKSYEYYYFKDNVRGDVASMQNLISKKKAFRFERYELRNSTKNFSIQRWLILLKQRLNQ